MLSDSMLEVKVTDFIRQFGIPSEKMLFRDAEFVFVHPLEINHLQVVTGGNGSLHTIVVMDNGLLFSTNETPEQIINRAQGKVAEQHVAF